MKFCYCPAGSFTMGSPKSEKGRGEDEDQVQVLLTRGFWMAQTECTQSQWASVMSDNPSSFKGSDLPVDSVSWEAAQGFVIKVNKLSGIIPRDHRIALPTEAQWEYACRANTTTAYNFADSASQLHKSANFGDKNLKLFGGRMANKTQDDGVGDTTARVASYRTNNWGLYDMHGNVCE